MKPAMPIAPTAAATPQTRCGAETAYRKASCCRRVKAEVRKRWKEPQVCVCSTCEWQRSPSRPASRGVMRQIWQWQKSGVHGGRYRTGTCQFECCWCCSTIFPVRSVRQMMSLLWSQCHGVWGGGCPCGKGVGKAGRPGLFAQHHPTSGTAVTKLFVQGERRRNHGGDEAIVRRRRCRFAARVQPQRNAKHCCDMLLPLFFRIHTVCVRVMLYTACKSARRTIRARRSVCACASAYALSLARRL